MICLKLLSRIFVFYLDLLAKYCKTKLYQWYDLSWIDWMISIGVIIRSLKLHICKRRFSDWIWAEYVNSCTRSVKTYAVDSAVFSLLFK